jgi:hypothetical protein
MQANALLSHCLKPLKADEASDEHPGNDERTFMLSVIRDLAPRDAIERRGVRNWQEIGGLCSHTSQLEKPLIFLGLIGFNAKLGHWQDMPLVCGFCLRCA